MVMASRVGAGEVWSGVGTLVVARGARASMSPHHGHPQGAPHHTLTCTRNSTRQVRVELPVEPLPPDLADGAIRARAFSIRGVHRFCAPDSLPTGQSFSNTARSSSPRRFLPF